MTDESNPPSQDQPETTDNGVPLLPRDQRWLLSDKANQELHATDAVLGETSNAAAVQEAISRWECEVKLHAVPNQLLDLPPDLFNAARVMLARFEAQGLVFAHYEADPLAFRVLWILAVRFHGSVQLYADQSSAVLLRKAPQPVVAPAPMNGFHFNGGLN